MFFCCCSGAGFEWKRKTRCRSFVAHRGQVGAAVPSRLGLRRLLRADHWLRSAWSRVQLWRRWRELKEECGYDAAALLIGVGRA